MPIKRKSKLCACGCGKEGPIYARKMLKECDRRVNPPKGLKKTGIKVKVSAKKQERIKESKLYYRQAIGRNILKNKGVSKCDECGEPIKSPNGRNVCHLIGSNANPALYLDPENHLILGKGPLYGECDCGWKFDESGERETMKIWPVAAERIERLNFKYHNNHEAYKRKFKRRN